jgi:hypothetical protein
MRLEEDSPETLLIRFESLAAATVWRGVRGSGPEKQELVRLFGTLVEDRARAYGHDTFSFTPQSTVIPCLYVVPKLAQIPQSGPERWQLETQLVRVRNRVSDALSDARALIEKTLAHIP